MLRLFVQLYDVLEKPSKPGRFDYCPKYQNYNLSFYNAINKK